MPRIGIGVGLDRVHFGGGFDADYRAVLNYATSLGYTLPSAGQQTKQNQLLIDLKSAGIWSKLDAFAMFATDGNSNFALIDWKRLVVMTAINCPTFSTNQGFNGNGTSSYVNTSFTPSNGVNYALNNCSFGYWAFSGLDTSGAKINIGCRNSASLGLTYPVGTNEATLLINSNTTVGGVLTASSSNLGLRHFNRIASTGCRYLNSTGVVGTNTNISGNIPTVSIFINALNSNGSPSSYTTTRISCVFAGASLATENSSLNSALSTYITSL